MRFYTRYFFAGLLGKNEMELRNNIVQLGHYVRDGKRYDTYVMHGYVDQIVKGDASDVRDNDHPYPVTFTITDTGLDIDRSDIHGQVLISRVFNWSESINAGFGIIPPVVVTVSNGSKGSDVTFKFMIHLNDVDQYAKQFAYTAWFRVRADGV